MVGSRLGWCTCSREEDDRVGLQEEGEKEYKFWGTREGLTRIKSEGKGVLSRAKTREAYETSETVMKCENCSLQHDRMQTYSQHLRPCNNRDLA
jgi:hypothetical protein